MNRIRLKEFCTIIAGQSPDSKYYNTSKEGLPFFQGKADFGELYPEIRVFCSSPTKIAEKDDILLSVRAPVGATNLSPGKVCIGRGLTAIRPNETVNLKYLLYFFRYYSEELNQKGTGTTFKAITQDIIKNIEVPVPNLSEQQNIVQRIEELFSQLDSGLETLKKTKQQLEVYRQAVLKEAFEKVVGKQCKISDVCDEIKVGIVIKPTQYYVDENGIMAFRNANVRRGYIEDADWVMISKDGHNKNLKSEVHTGDVLISRSGANLGMASPISEKYDGYNAIDVVIAVPKKNKILPEFLAYYTNSPMGKSIVKKNERGAAQGHLNVTVYGNLPIMLPNIEEQKHIIDGLEVKLSACDSIAQTIETALRQAESMRQSILKQAFEGE